MRLIAAEYLLAAEILIQSKRDFSVSKAKILNSAEFIAVPSALLSLCSAYILFISQSIDLMRLKNSSIEEYSFQKLHALFEFSNFLSIFFLLM